MQSESEKTHLVFAVPRNTTATCLVLSLLFVIASNASTSGTDANLAGHGGYAESFAQKIPHGAFRRRERTLSMDSVLPSMIHSKMSL